MVDFKKIAKEIGSKSYTAVDRTVGATSKVITVGGKAIKKIPNKKLKYKKITKKSKTTLHLKQKEVPSVLADPNRFFKDEMEEAKNAMFFK